MRIKGGGGPEDQARPPQSLAGGKTAEKQTRQEIIDVSALKNPNRCAPLRRAASENVHPRNSAKRAMGGGDRGGGKTNTWRKLSEKEGTGRKESYRGSENGSVLAWSSAGGDGMGFKKTQGQMMTAFFRTTIG